MRPGPQAITRRGHSSTRGAHAKRILSQKPAWIGLPPEPDRGFVRKLKAFDPDLSVEFDRRLGKFVIMQEGQISGRVVAMVIEGEGRSGSGFRQPDERDLMRLKMADLRNEMARRAMRDRAEELQTIREKDEKHARDTIHEASKDDKHYIKRAYRKMLNDGKALPPYRQVTPRPRGKVFK